MAKGKAKAGKTQLSDDDKFLKLMEELYNLTKVQDKLEPADISVRIKKYYGKTTKSLKIIVRTSLATFDRNNLELIFYYIDNVYPKIWSNPSTLDNYFTQDVRNVMSKRFGVGSKEHEMAKNDVALPWDVKGALEAERKQKAIAKNQKPLRIRSSEIIGFIRDNIVSEDPFRKAVALLIASGSRPVELFLRSDYEEYEDEYISGHWVKQTKIAKKKGRDVEVYKPIIYLKAKDFISELEYVRAKLKERYGSLSQNNDPEQIRTSIRDGANNVAKEIFGNVITDQDTKENKLYTARKLYAALSYELFGRNTITVHGTTIPYSLWISLVLGHEANTGSLNNYTHVYLIEENETNEGLTARQNLLEQKVEELEERLEEKQIPKNEEKPIPVVSPGEEALKKLTPYFNDFVKNEGRKPSQSTFEKITKSVLPRATVRKVYKELYRIE